MSTIIYSGQGEAKDTFAGDRQMNRYAIFNGLEKPRRIDHLGTVGQLGYDVPEITSVTSVAVAGSLTDTKWVAYRAVYGSTKYPRPVSVLDGSGAMTRGNPSATIKSQQNTQGDDTSMNVVVPGSADAAVTHILLYRSLEKSTQADAEAGPFYYVTKKANAAGNVTINDGTADNLVGVEVETDNFKPNAYRFAIAAHGYVFAGGSVVIGADYTCTVTPGSSTVTVSSSILYDGVTGWTFRCTEDASGGTDGNGTYYANYVSGNTLQLVDEDGDAKNYDGDLNGSGKAFRLYLPGYLLRWCKYGEPEAWPLTNSITFEGDITGLAEMPNAPLLMVGTDTPAMWTLDLTQISSVVFKTNRRRISSRYSPTSHYSLVAVEERLRGIDARSKCIFETDGVLVSDISSLAVPEIFDYLETTQSIVGNWHCAYDPAQKIFGAFMTFRNSHRMIDFCVGQNTQTGGWFFNWEKDLLSSAPYVDPTTNRHMVIGGTQGLGDSGAVWGRIWTPGRYTEWVVEAYPYYGTVSSATANSITVSGGGLYTHEGGHIGRWVFVCDTNGENSQLGYITSNTADVLSIGSVVGNTFGLGFDPVPSSGWYFYIGMIEVRWGPKWLDFKLPDLDKKVLQVSATVTGYSSTDLPILRVYRNLGKGYRANGRFVEEMNADESANNTLTIRFKDLGGSTHRWGMAILDRGYGAFKLRDVSVYFDPDKLKA